MIAFDQEAGEAQCEYCGLVCKCFEDSAGKLRCEECDQEFSDEYNERLTFMED